VAGIGTIAGIISIVVAVVAIILAPKADWWNNAYKKKKKSASDGHVHNGVLNTSNANVGRNGASVDLIEF
jgi:hypothetical protein